MMRKIVKLFKLIITLIKLHKNNHETLLSEFLNIIINLMFQLFN